MGPYRKSQVRGLFPLLAGSVIIGLCFGSTMALAVSISVTIPGCPVINIADRVGALGDVNDTNPAANVIDFDTSNIAAIADCGIVADGTVKLGGAGALTKLGAGAQIVNLTKLTVLKTVGAANTITLHYDHTFQVPDPPIMAEDGIVGTFDDVHLGSSSQGDSITFQGFVNGAPIMPIKQGDGAGLPFVYTTVGLKIPDEPFMGGHGPQAIKKGGPPWTLSGDVTVLLAVVSDRLKLADSAEVGIAGVPQPSTWLLLATGLVGLLGYGWWRRWAA